MYEAVGNFTAADAQKTLSNVWPTANHLSGQWARRIRLFNKDLRGLLQVAPNYMKPVRYEARKLQDLLGQPQMTSYDSGIGQTLAWIASPVASRA